MQAGLIIKYLPAFSESFIFYLFSTLLSSAAAACSLLQIKAVVMQHSYAVLAALLIQKERKDSLRVYVCFPTTQRLLKSRRLDFTVPLQKELTAM